jgi:hypothetical protein
LCVRTRSGPVGPILLVPVVRREPVGLDCVDAFAALSAEHRKLRAPSQKCGLGSAWEATAPSLTGSSASPSIWGRGRAAQPACFCAALIALISSPSAFCSAVKRCNETLPAMVVAITLTLSFFRSNRLPSVSSLFAPCFNFEGQALDLVLQLFDARFASGGLRCRRLVRGVVGSFHCGWVVHSGADVPRQRSIWPRFSAAQSACCGLPCRVRAPIGVHRAKGRTLYCSWHRLARWCRRDALPGSGFDGERASGLTEDGFVGISPTDGTGMASNERPDRRTRKEFFAPGRGRARGV